MIHQVFRASPPRLPLTSYQDFSAFKLYMHDVGLLGAMSGTAPSMLLDGNALFTNFKGALAEQFVLQELASDGITASYWSSDSGSAEVEFVVQGEKDVFPIEAKAGINTKAKSLRVYRELFSPPYAIRTSLQPHHDGESVKDIPLYAFGSHIARLIARQAWPSARGGPSCGIGRRDYSLNKSSRASTNATDPRAPESGQLQVHARTKSARKTTI